MKQAPYLKSKNLTPIALGAAIILIALGFSNFSTELFTPNQKQELGGGYGEEVLVTRVIDGDTIEIKGGERVRYLGIDTPETVDPRRPVGCFGHEASAKNKELVEGKYIRLEKDITERDKYGRLLRYVYIQDKFVNLELVKGGYAVIYTFPPDVKHQEELLAAQREAREAKRGLWGACLSFDSV